MELYLHTPTTFKTTKAYSRSHFFPYPTKTENIISEDFHCSINSGCYEYKLILVGLPILVKD